MHSRPQSLRSFWPATGIESSGSNHFEITKEIIEFCPPGFTSSASMAHEWNGCSQTSRFLPQARRILGSGTRMTEMCMRRCMRRVHLSMRTEGIKAFSKRIRRCSVDGRKRYENDKCGRNSFWKRSKTAPFSFEKGLVQTGPKPSTKAESHCFISNLTTPPKKCFWD